MAFDAGAIVAKLRLDASGFTGVVKTVEAQAAGFGEKLGRVSKSLTSIATSAGAAGRTLMIGVTMPLMAVGGAALKMAMDATESENLFEVSMGNMAGAARTWSDELSTTLGLNAYEVRKTTGTFNVMFDAMGLGQEASYGMAKGLTQLSYDMASFYNLKPEEAMMKLQAGISGEIEPLKRLGLVVNETTVKAYAMAQGWIKQGQELTEQQKIQARYNLILSQTGKAQGDLARTIDSPTNQLRLLKSQTTQVAVELGQMLVPALKAVMEKVQAGIVWWKNLSQEKKELIIKIAAVAAALGPLLMGLSKVLSIVNLGITAVGGLAKGVSFLAGHLSLSLVAWGAVIALAAKYVMILIELRSANKYAEEATARFNVANADLAKKLEDAATRAGLTKEAFAQLTAKYEGNSAAMAMAIQQGKEGEAMQKGLAAAGGEHSVVLEAQNKKVAEITNSYGLMAPAVDAAGKANSAFSDFLKDKGIATMDAQVGKLKEGREWLGQLDAMLKSGKLSQEQYAKAVAALNEDLEKYGTRVLEAVPPSRDLSGIMDKLAPKLEENVYGFSSLEAAMEEFTRMTGYSGETLRLYLYDIMRLQLEMLGFHLPNLTIDMAPVEQNAKQAHDTWAGVFSDLSRQFGNTFQGFVETWSWDAIINGKINFKSFFDDIWKNIKDTFFRLIGDLAAEWVEGFLTKIIAGKTGEALAGAATDVLGTATQTMSDVAGAAGSAVSGVAGGVINTISGVVTAAAAVLDLLAPAKKQTDVTYWLKLIKDLGQEDHDRLRDITNWLFNEAWPKIYTLSDSMVDAVGVLRNIESRMIDEMEYLIPIEKNIALLASKIPAAASGAVLMAPSLIIGGEQAPRIPEIIAPLPDYLAAMEGGRRGANINISPVFNITAFDAAGVRDAVRSKIAPEFIAWLKANLGKTFLQEALGV